MAGIDAPRLAFGVFAASFYDRDTELPYKNGLLKAIQSYDNPQTQETVDLLAGGSKLPIASENGTITNDISIVVNELPAFLYTLSGYTVTEGAAEANGGITTATNKKGTSTIDATTGIASVSILAGSETNLKGGKYIIEVLSPITVALYKPSDVRFNRGTAVTYADNTLKIEEAKLLTIASAADTDVTELGLTLTGGSGAIGMTVGDTAYFEVREPNQGYTSIKFTDNPIAKEFGLYLYTLQRKNGEGKVIEFPKVSLSPIPESASIGAWGEYTLAMKFKNDTVKGYPYKIDDTIFEI